MIPSGATIGGYHTYSDLKLIPCAKLIIAPPQPKIITYDIIGVDGAIDVTDALYGGGVPYANSKGTWDFIVMSGAEYWKAYSNCLSVFNGERATLVLDDLPGTEFTGRFSVNAWKSWEQFSKIAVDYNIEPW